MRSSIGSRPVVLALTGALAIAFSGLLVRLADVEPATAAFYRCLYALPFLLLVPITFGAVAYKGFMDVVLGDLPPGMAGPFLVGSLASGASALVAISALLGYIRRHDYSLFVWYRFAAGAVVLLLIATGVRSAGF